MADRCRCLCDNGCPATSCPAASNQDGIVLCMTFCPSSCTNPISGPIQLAVTTSPNCMCSCSDGCPARTCGLANGLCFSFCPTSCAALPSSKPVPSHIPTEQSPIPSGFGFPCQCSQLEPGCTLVPLIQSTSNCPAACSNVCRPSSNTQFPGVPVAELPLSPGIIEAIVAGVIVLIIIGVTCFISVRRGYLFKSKSTNEVSPATQVAPTTIDSAGTELLPQGWEAKKTDDGRVYFVNHNTSTTTWNDPRTGAPSDGNVVEERVASDGRTYYVNHATQATTWTDPRVGTISTDTSSQAPPNDLPETSSPRRYVSNLPTYQVGSSQA
ncbi:hypothetical protein BCR33DRAFT_860041 [Rhizoclosmatium globosum]|uniref:WW domain-containing protein n=1 Tax=Rhizoclosmatium globosum TaxID=329046 RepID=A0A1Y2AR46_9FUNG|nr:hypothetical protein BCR33DRAFT_860041 [Rhizoclosmatium globosum]|eukprot:ORY24944.1 hypothetical protein BCR33DRAFT_860041 [Rhizoclosmatium globosum]